MLTYLLEGSFTRLSVFSSTFSLGLAENLSALDSVIIRKAYLVELLEGMSHNLCNNKCKDIVNHKKDTPDHY